MPTGTLKNLLYRASLPLLVPKPQLTVQCVGAEPSDPHRLLTILRNNRVNGGAVLKTDRSLESLSLFSTKNVQVTP